MPRSPHAHRHELGQNFLRHPRSISAVVDLVAATSGSILEIGAGRGALTMPLIALGRRLTAIDVDRRAVQRLRSLCATTPHVDVECADALHHPLAADVLVGNIPFHLTTPLLRRLLNTGNWHTAVLLVQWEVARKRAGVGGRTMMGAQYGPWFDFTLHGRIPAHHFSPAPTVDGGVLRVERRRQPLVAGSDRADFQHFVHRVFTGRGRSLAEIVAGAAGISRQRAVGMTSYLGLTRSARPRDLTPDDWAQLWAALDSYQGQPGRSC